MRYGFIMLSAVLICTQVSAANQQCERKLIKGPNADNSAIVQLCKSFIPMEKCEPVNFIYLVFDPRG